MEEEGGRGKTGYERIVNRRASLNSQVEVRLQSNDFPTESNTVAPLPGQDVFRFLH